MTIPPSAATTKEKLASLAGVHPSTEWLEACRQHLRLQPQQRQHTNGDEDDAILHQILHSDLRDVIRSTAPSDETSETPGKILRRAIHASEPNTNTIPDSPCKSILPATFSVLIQVEESLDVSLNAEARLNYGPASPTSPTPVGNQRMRCLKMKCSDGYNHNGDAYYQGEEERKENEELQQLKQHIIAMEISPIPSLSVHSKPGIKLLLRGPITVRLGVLMLHPGNATILGGCIPALIPIQKKAYEMANRIAGVGVDPTVKALIWNPHTGAEEDEDEGEQESGDVPMRTPNAAAAPPPISIDQAQITAVNQSTTLPPSVHTTQISKPNMNRSTAVNASARRAGGVATSRATSSSTSTVARDHQQQQQPIDRFLQQKKSNAAPATSTATASNSTSEPMEWSPSTNTSIPTPSTTTTMRSESTSSKTTNPYASSTTSRNNPYASLRSSSASSMTSTNTNAPKHPPSTFKTPSASAARKNRRLTGAFPDTPVDLTSPDDNTCTSEKNPLSANKESGMMTPRPPPQYSTSSSIQPSNVISSQESLASLPSMTPTPSNPITTHRTATNTPTILSISPTALTEPLSFVEMRSLILEAIKNPNLYEQCANKMYVVPAKMTATQLCFDIQKRGRKKGEEGKKRSKLSTHKDKYEYNMTCRFIGPNEDSGTITCKIDSPILVPFFGMSAAEMRRLSRTDSSECNRVVDRGGRLAISELKALAPTCMKFFRPREAFFADESPFDIASKEPIMKIIGRQS